MELFIVLLIGLCIGSFLNVCIYRIANGQSIAYPPSHCTKCGEQIKRRDLIPVISYILLKGKCRNCGDKISFKYPLIEILNGIAYLLLYINFGISMIFIKGCIFISLLIVIAMIDFNTHEVFNSTIVFGVTVGIVFIVIESFINRSIPWDNVIGAIIGYVSIWIIVIVSHGMGEGDIDIAMLCGLFLGVKGIILALFIAFVIGGIVATILLILRIKGKKSEIAFGPYLALGGIITYLFGCRIVELYVGFL